MGEFAEALWFFRIFSDPFGDAGVALDRTATRLGNELWESPSGSGRTMSSGLLMAS